MFKKKLAKMLSEQNPIPLPELAPITEVDKKASRKQQIARMLAAKAHGKGY